MKKLILLGTTLLVFGFAQEKPVKCWIYFTSKDQTGLRKSASIAAEAKAIGISERAIKRRAKVNAPILSEDDLPVSSSYLSQISSIGITIENQSRWFNAVTAYLSASQRNELLQRSFVKSIEPVRTFVRSELPPAAALAHAFAKSTTDRFSYGPSLTQMELIDAVKVHNIGISGRGVLVGMLDTGFRWREHEALQNRDVIAEYDFIQKDSITENQTGDAASQDSHGTYTFSDVGGFKEGQLVSPAFNASFMLAKTEYVPTETNIEEDNWVAGIEWMEQYGVDVVSSSLGYNEFDATDAYGNPQHSYTYADLNGRTATTTKAAVIAMRKGVVVCNAAGNEAGNSWHYLITPADADSIVTVGAVSSSKIYASFSSVGPTSDGRIKPDVASQGVSTYCAVPPGKVSSYGSFNGTSLATPLVAGVAAMILSAHPELTPVQVRDALRNTASNASTPNDSIGWGIIDAYKAVLYNGLVIGTDPEIALTSDSNYSVGMFVVSNNPIVKDSVKLFYTTNNGASYSSVPMTVSEVVDSSTQSGKYIGIISSVDSASNINFYVQAMDNTLLKRTCPYNAPSIAYNLSSGTTNVKRYPNVPLAFALDQNFPNPFNPDTKITFHIPATENVSLKVYDVLGREVATLVNETKPANDYAVIFSGAHFASGVYFYRLQTPTFSSTKKMVLTK
jgi:serine protease AprX